MKKIYIDGSGWNGRECKAIVVGEDGILLRIKTTSEMTSNQMEYKALLMALEKCTTDGDEIITDSQLIVGQMTKGWRILSPNLKVIASDCKELLKQKKIKLTWVPREENIAGKVLEHGF